MNIDAGESMGQKRNKTYTGPVTENVASDWGYNLTWTLRAGSQTIEQHEYMEFRYVNLKFSAGEVPASFNLSAWQVQATYVEGESHFESSSEGNESTILQAVWELNRYTAQAAVLDTCA